MRRRDLSTALIASTVGAGLTSGRATADPPAAPFYPRTEPEIAARVTPLNYREPPGNPRRYGAAGDGRTPDRAALAAQGSTGEQIYLTRGTYLVESDLVISSAVWCEQNAILKVADGVTLSFTGPFDGTKSRHFALSGRGKVQFGAAPNQWPCEAVAPLCPEYWGAVSVNAGDSTAAVQACVDCNRDVRFYQDYSVSQIVLAGNELHIDFAGFSLIGNGHSGSFTSVLDIKCGYSTLRDVTVDANFNPRYQCAIHWYTNSLGRHYPGFNRIYGMWARNALIGLCIGALPGQPRGLPPQGANAAAGVATDAPLSESAVFGFQTLCCVRGLWMSQANGKVTMVGATIIGSHANWRSYGDSGYTHASSCALTIDNVPGQFSELHLSGGSLEQNSEPAGQFIRLQNAHLYCCGTILEAVCSSYFSGEVGVSFRDCMDFGFDFPAAYSPFLVAPGCIGWLNISGGCINFPSGYARAAVSPLVRAASGGPERLAVNYGHFLVRFDHVELRNVPFTATSGYVPLCQGVGFSLDDCLLTGYGPGLSRISVVRLDDRASALDGRVDVSNHAIAEFSTHGDGAAGGWKFSVTDKTRCKWGSEPSGITVEDHAVARALRLACDHGAGNVVTATSPTLDLTPGSSYVLRGWIRSSAQSGGRIRIRAAHLRFDGAVSAISAYSEFVDLSSAHLSRDFQQLAAHFTLPADSSRVQLEISGSDGADVSVCGVELS
jgi:hypothetical protein